MLEDDWKIKQKLISRKVGQNPLFLFQEKDFTACMFQKLILVRQNLSSTVALTPPSLSEEQNIQDH